MTDTLLLKYIKGITSMEETRKVESWILASQENTDHFEKVKLDYVLNTFEKTEQENPPDQAYNSFRNKHIRRRTHYKKIAPVFPYAAVVALLITTYFIFGDSEKTQDTVIPSDVITLELENGDIKIINEDGKTEVYDNEGHLVGKQKGKSLEYVNSPSKKELAYNTITVPYGKTFELLLSDGTRAHLNAGSSLRYPTQFLEGFKRQVFLTGEAYLDVAKDSLHPFIVGADMLNVRVLGTEFNISAYPEDETTEVVLVEGSVGLYQKENGYDAQKSIPLEPGFKGSFNRTQQTIETKEVITSVYTSWINGKLVFRNMAFKNILKKLERHYNVTIVNNNGDLANEKFNANFGKEPIQTVLEEFKDSYGIGYKFADDRIIIEP
ncbi:MAG: FecR domain-containing protein [Bacteroidota bacterium]